MTDDIDSPADVEDPEDVAALLVAYRLLIYFGGLAVIGAPLALQSLAGVTTPASVRAALTVTVVALMIVTYLSERRVGGPPTSGSAPGADASTADSSNDGYPLRTRVAVAAAVLGLAIGVYVALEVSRVGGVLFVAGSYMFAYLAYDSDWGDR